MLKPGRKSLPCLGMEAAAKMEEKGSIGTERVLTAPVAARFILIARGTGVPILTAC